VTVALADYGMGNRRSVEKALEHVGARVVRTADPEAIGAAEAIVVPGVGAFPEAMRRLRALGLDAVIRERAGSGVPVLGICLGMQLLFEDTTEHGGAEGIGLLEGSVRQLDAPGLKVPQIGWNPVAWRRESPLTRGLGDPVAMYHVHSFAAFPAHAEDIVGTADYGSEFTSVVHRENVHGVQFHPEKSGPDGLALLANFVRVCAPAPAAA
jgi:imidazole glycerol-phosphate synthase subunit HisH